MKEHHGEIILFILMLIEVSGLQVLLIECVVPRHYKARSPSASNLEEIIERKRKFVMEAVETWGSLAGLKFVAWEKFWFKI